MQADITLTDYRKQKVSCCYKHLSEKYGSNWTGQDIPFAVLGMYQVSKAERGVLRTVCRDEYYALKYKAERKMEYMDDRPLALHLMDGTYICIDCYALFIEEESGNIWKVIVDASDICLALVDNLSDVDELIHDDTVQFESFPGQIIPLDGIYCCKCDEQLYAPYEEE